jgi:hypothetical protein
MNRTTPRALAAALVLADAAACSDITGSEGPDSV